ncbi:hypothetical protein Tco_0494009 [Tanacetum coccineum]
MAKHLTMFGYPMETHREEHYPRSYKSSFGIWTQVVNYQFFSFAYKSLILCTVFMTKQVVIIASALTIKRSALHRGIIGDIILLSAAFENSIRIHSTTESIADAEHAPAMAPPIRTDEQIMPRIRCVPIGKSNCYLNEEKSQSSPIYKILSDISQGNKFLQRLLQLSINIPTIYFQTILGYICFDIGVSNEVMHLFNVTSMTCSNRGGHSQPLSICALRERLLDLKGQEPQCYRSSGVSSIELTLIMLKGCGKNLLSPSTISQKTRGESEKLQSIKDILAGEEVSEPESPAHKDAKPTNRSQPSKLNRSDPKAAKLKKPNTAQPKLKRRNKGFQCLLKTPGLKTRGRIMHRFWEESTYRCLHNSKAVHFRPVVLWKPKAGKTSTHTEVAWMGRRMLDVRSWNKDELRPGWIMDALVIPEEPASSTGTLSSLQQLGKDFSFGDQFFNDKPSDAENEKTTSDTKAESRWLPLFVFFISILLVFVFKSPGKTPLSIRLCMLRCIGPVPRPDSLIVYWPLPPPQTTTSANNNYKLFLYHLNHNKVHQSYSSSSVWVNLRAYRNLVEGKSALKSTYRQEGSRINKCGITIRLTKMIREQTVEFIDSHGGLIRKDNESVKEAHLGIIAHRSYNSAQDTPPQLRPHPLIRESSSQCSSSPVPDGRMHIVLTDKVDDAILKLRGNLVPDQFWIEEECKYDIAAMYGISHWWFQRQRFYIDRFSFEKIILRRADLKEYVIAERDFKYMYPSDFEEDFQLGLRVTNEVNLTKPRWDATDLSSSMTHSHRLSKAVTFSEKIRDKSWMEYKIMTKERRCQKQGVHVRYPETAKDTTYLPESGELCWWTDSRRRLSVLKEPNVG